MIGDLHVARQLAEMIGWVIMCSMGIIGAALFLWAASAFAWHKVKAAGFALHAIRTWRSARQEVSEDV